MKTLEQVQSMNCYQTHLHVGLYSRAQIMERLITPRTNTQTRRPPRWMFHSHVVECSIYMSSRVPERQHNNHIGYLKLIESLRIPYPDSS